MYFSSSSSRDIALLLCYCYLSSLFHPLFDIDWLQLVEDSMLKLDRICRDANVKLVLVRSYGLAGFVRISVKVINTTCLDPICDKV